MFTETNTNTNTNCYVQPIVRTVQTLYVYTIYEYRYVNNHILNFDLGKIQPAL
jgi:hypothetical protein